MKNTKFDRSFWNPQPHPPLPFLASLREQVLLHNEKRCPKWRFRLAPDLVVQIQPRPVSLLSPVALERGRCQRTLAFVGVVFRAESITAKDVAEWHGRGADKWRLRFELYAELGSDTWLFAARSVGGADWDNSAFAWRDRIRSCLSPKRFSSFDPKLMLAPHCLCCGKALTDPASMARYIGPECAGTSSLNVPGVLRALGGNHG